MTQNSRPLTSVHEALQNAVLADQPEPGTPTSFRLEDNVKREAMAICVRHGTNLSEYLRQCCISLVSDYADPSRG